MKEPIKICDMGAVADKNYLAYLISNSISTYELFNIRLSNGTDINLANHFFARYSDHSILLSINDTDWEQDTLITSMDRYLTNTSYTPAQMVQYMSNAYTHWLSNSTYRNDNPILNETFKFLFAIYKIYMSYYERLDALWSLSEQMLYTDDLDNLLNDSYVLTTGTSSSSQKSASVSHPLDASDIDEGIVDISGTGEDNSDNTSSTTNRTRNYFAQFKNLWYNWKDIKQDIVNAMSYLFVEVLDI